MNKLILVLLALLLVSTYSLRISTARIISMDDHYITQETCLFGYCKTYTYKYKLQINDNEASLDEKCELCFGGDEASRVQLEEDEGFDCKTIANDCFDDDGSSE